MIDTKALRQKVLDLAIRGKLVPQDPSDEPAAVLLERIREEKQKLVKEGKLKAKDIKNDSIIFVGEDNLHYEKFADGTVKCIEDEIPFEVPEGWAWARLTSICSLISDIDHKMPKAVDNGVLFLSAKDLLNDGTINYTDDVKMISEEDFLRLSRKALPQKNDIIYSRIGACLGKARVVTKDIRFIVSYSCCTIRPVIIDSTFLASILDGNFVLDQAKEGTQSVGVPDLGMASIKQFFIPIPPLAEQQRIDERLQYALNIVQLISTEHDSLSLAVVQAKSKILDLAIRGQLVPQNPDDEPASVLLERIRAEKEELIKQGKIKRDKKESFIFRGDDNSYYETIGKDTVCIDEELPFDIPEGWGWSRLQNISSVLTDGTHKTPTYSDEGYIFLSSKNVTTGKIDWENVVCIPESLHVELYKRLAPMQGDILLAKNGTTGVAALVDKDAIFDIYVSLALIRLIGEKLHPQYILNVIGSSYVQEYFKKSLKGIGVPNLHLEHIRKTLIPIPPYVEQKQIVEFTNKMSHMIEKISDSLL